VHVVAAAAVIPLPEAWASVTGVETRWQRWYGRFDDTYGDVQMMFHIRHIWTNLITLLEQNTALGDTAIAKNGDCTCDGSVRV
jgi:hypothetical protein